MKRIFTALKMMGSLVLCAALLAGCAVLPADSAPEAAPPADPLTGLEAR